MDKIKCVIQLRFVFFFLHRVKYNPANAMAHSYFYVFSATGTSGYQNLIFEKNSICKVWIMEVQQKAVKTSRTENNPSVFYEITNRCSYMQSILFHC